MIAGRGHAHAPPSRKQPPRRRAHADDHCPVMPRANGRSIATPAKQAAQFVDLACGNSLTIP